MEQLIYTALFLFGLSVGYFIHKLEHRKTLEILMFELEINKRIVEYCCNRIRELEDKYEPRERKDV